MGVSISVSQSSKSKEGSTVNRDVSSNNAKPAVSNISSSASTEDSIDILPGAGKPNNADSDDVAKPVMFCGLKFSKTKKCTKCPFKGHHAQEPRVSFSTLDNKLIAASLRYLDASESIYLQQLCKKVDKVLHTESWCEVLHLNGLWRGEGVDTDKLCKKWFPYLKGVTQCVHREALVIKPDGEKKFDANFRRTTSYNQINAYKPLSSPTNSNFQPITPRTHAQRSPSVKRLPSFSPRNANVAVKYAREKWTDIHPAELTTFLKASKDTLTSLIVFYNGNYTVDSVLRPVTEPLCLSKLTELRFTLMSDESATNNTVASDTEHIVLAIKPLDIPNCKNLQMCGSQNSNAAATEENGPRLGRIASSSRMNPFVNDRMPSLSPKSHRSSNMDVVEAFGKIITRPDDLQSLNIELNQNDAEMVADLLPYVLEV